MSERKKQQGENKIETTIGASGEGFKTFKKAKEKLCVILGVPITDKTAIELISQLVLVSDKNILIEYLEKIKCAKGVVYN